MTNPAKFLGAIAILIAAATAQAGTVKMRVPIYGVPAPQQHALTQTFTFDPSNGADIPTQNGVTSYTPYANQAPTWARKAIVTVVGAGGASGCGAGGSGMKLQAEIDAPFGGSTVAVNVGEGGQPMGWNQGIGIIAFFEPTGATGGAYTSVTLGAYTMTAGAGGAAGLYFSSCATQSDGGNGGYPNGLGGAFGDANSANPGTGASQTTPGSGGAGSSCNGNTAGLSGSGHFGGQAAPTMQSGITHPGVYGGGGGDGYYGGGSGAPGDHNGGNCDQTGAGGGGSSFASSGVKALSATLAGNGAPATAGTGQNGGNGAVTITWEP